MIKRKYGLYLEQYEVWIQIVYDRERQIIGWILFLSNEGLWGLETEGECWGLYSKKMNI